MDALAWAVLHVGGLGDLPEQACGGGGGGKRGGKITGDFNVSVCARARVCVRMYVATSVLLTILRSPPLDTPFPPSLLVIFSLL